MTNLRFFPAPPESDTITPYDEAHLVTYLRILDGVAEGADWREIAEIVLELPAGYNIDQARLQYDAHLARAQWMTEHGYRHLLQMSGQPDR